jgi:hypothetical protein
VSTSGSVKHLDQFAKQAAAKNLEVLGFPNQADVGLTEYPDALGEKPLDKKALFLRLCKFLEEQP